MKLGDFFKAAPHARPVNPKVVTFTAVAKGKVLPGGAPNPSGGQVAAQITAAMVFIGAGAADARLDAKKALRARRPDDVIDNVDLNIEALYHELWRELHEWDPEARKVGDRLFPNVDALRELLEPSEAQRLGTIYNEYAEEEHPAAVDARTFRPANSGGPRVAVNEPR